MIVKNDANTNQLVIKGKPEEVAEMLLQFIYKVKDGATLPPPPIIVESLPEPPPPQPVKRSVTVKTQLYRERRKLGWAQMDVGRKLGCSDSHISMIELRTRPALKVYQTALAHLYGRTVADLFDIEGYALLERG